MSIYPNNGNNGSPIQNPFGGNSSGVIINGMPMAIPQIDVSAVMRFVYLWMGLGLTVTAIVAAFLNSSPTIMRSLYTNSSLLWGAIIAQFVVVIALTWGLQKMSPSVAGIMFLVYSALTGITVGMVVSFYTTSSVAMAFGTTAVLFGAMTIFAFTTKIDLTQFRTFFIMGLIGLLVATLLNVFIFRSEGFNLALSYFGVVLFTGLTAYDTYKIKKMAESPEFAMQGSDAVLRLSIYGALNLYLDFINLFLYLLRILGTRRD